MISTVQNCVADTVGFFKILSGARRFPANEHLAYFFRYIRLSKGAELGWLKERKTEMRLGIFEETPFFFGRVVFTFQRVPENGERLWRREVVAKSGEETITRFRRSACTL